MIACVCRAAVAAAPASKWRSAVRVCRSGHVIEPASGAFDVTVAPGEGVQVAVDACPPGGCVLLLPGTHEGSLTLAVDKEVHVFGRGLATLWTAAGAVVDSEAAKSTLDGLAIRREASRFWFYGVWIRGGGLRLQDCRITCASGSSVVVAGGADPVLTSCRCARVHERATLKLFPSLIDIGGEWVDFCR